MDTAWDIRIVGHGDEPPDQLLANPRNWRVHPAAQQQALAGVIDDVGFVRSVTVNRRTGHVVDGHLRVLAAISAGQATIPVEYVDLSPEEEWEVLATLDPIGTMAGSDSKALADLVASVETEDDRVAGILDSLTNGDFTFGFGGRVRSRVTTPGAEVDRADELLAKWGVEGGDLWLIGDHRLLCGDATDGIWANRLMGGVRASLLATDPPYNVGVEYGDAVDDLKSNREYEAFTRRWFGVWSAVSDRQIVTPGSNNLASWCRWFAPYHVAPWTKANAMTHGKVSRWWCWEPVMFFGHGWERDRASDVFDFPVSPQTAQGMGSLTPLHPCPKPLPLWVDLIANYAVAGAVVADPFCGSGTAFVAAEQSGRRCFGMEIEPKYCAVTLERLAGMGLDCRRDD